jgi:hypothetical protein
MAIDPNRRYRRREAATVCREEGIPVTLSSLATKASSGGGPKFQLFGRVPLYLGSDLIAWIEEKLSAKFGSTSEAGVARHTVSGTPTTTPDQAATR